MPRNVRIVTTSLATFEDVAPPLNLRSPNPEENIATVESILATASGFAPDLVVLPETFKLAGLPGSAVRDVSEAIDGPTVSRLSNACRQGRFNLVAGHLVSEGNRVFNEAIVINRSGEVVGRYRKNYPVQSEISNGVSPGIDVPVFDLDCLRIGAAICFDINWPELWATFRSRKVDLACWISAYEGGFPIRSLAWVNRYPIVTAVYPYHGRIIEATGEIIASTSRWSRVTALDMNFDRVLCHTDRQMDRIAVIQRKYGNQVKIKTYTEEHLMLIENNVPNQTIEDIMREFDLVSYNDYIAECTRYRDTRLTGE